MIEFSLYVIMPGRRCGTLAIFAYSHEMIKQRAESYGKCFIVHKAWPCSNLDCLPNVELLCYRFQQFVL